MSLYQINQSHYPETVEHDWQNSLKDGDSVLLIEAGVLRTAKHDIALEALNAKNIRILLRDSDVKAYGIQPQLGECITDEQWLHETTLHERIISW